MSRQSIERQADPYAKLLPPHTGPQLEVGPEIREELERLYQQFSQSIERALQEHPYWQPDFSDN